MQNKTGRPFAAGFFYYYYFYPQKCNQFSIDLVRSFVGVHGAIDRGNVDKGTQ
jgi:hypothetical protein